MNILLFQSNYFRHLQLVRKDRIRLVYSYFQITKISSKLSWEFNSLYGLREAIKTKYINKYIYMNIRIHRKPLWHT
jgi:hypothetical protein